MMKISEAAKLANESGLAIMLKRDGMIIRLLPTNTTSSIIESVGNGEHLVYWEPTLADLISNQWEVTNEFRLQPLPNDSAGPVGVPAMLPEDYKRIQKLEREWYRTR